MSKREQVKRYLANQIARFETIKAKIESQAAPATAMADAEMKADEARPAAESRDSWNPKPEEATQETLEVGATENA